MKSRLLIFITILALSLSACVSLAEDITPPPNAQQPAPQATEAPVEEAPAKAPPADVDGAALFAANCTKCHGTDGRGATTTADLTDSGRMNMFPDEMLFALISMGNDSGMPEFSDKLSETEIWALVAHLREIAEETPLAESTPEREEQAETESESDAEEVGSITGIVINGSGGKLPKDLTVELEAYDHDVMSGGFNKVFTLETSLYADGSYLFEEVEMAEGRAFLTTITDKGVFYSSQPNFVTEGSNTLDLPITYYETSSDASQLSIDRLHIFFEPPNINVDIVQVIEVFVVTNPTLYAIVPEEERQAVIEFALPEGSTNIQFEDSIFGERYTQTKDGFGDTTPILPGIGQHEIVVFFEMPYKRKMDFSQLVNHPIDSATVMAPQGLKIKSDLLQEGGEREAQGLIYNIFSSQPLPIGATLTMQVSGKVSTSVTGPDPDSQQNIIFGLMAFGIVLIGAGVWLFIRNRDDEDDDYEDEEDDNKVEFDDTDKIMDAIIALDDGYRSGHLSEEAYKKRRAELKAQLRELVD